MHWATNQTVCALTEMEKLLRGTRDDNQTFFGKVVGPVYSFKSQDVEDATVWMIMISLWMITVIRLHNNGFGKLARVFGFYSSSS